MVINPREDVKPTEALDAKVTFTVASQYKGCDVVRWTDGNQAEFFFFR